MLKSLVSHFYTKMHLICTILRNASRLLPFWYRVTWVVPEKGPLNGCVCVCVTKVVLEKRPLSGYSSSRYLMFITYDSDLQCTKISIRNVVSQFTNMISDDLTILKVNCT